MTHLHRTSCFALTLSLALGACDSQTTDDESFAEGVPETAAFALSVTEPEETVPTTAAFELGTARAAVGELNDSLRAFLESVEIMVAETEPTTESDRLRVWGPVERGATEYRFTLAKGVGKRFGWQLEARPAQSESPYLRVAAGGIAVGQVARRGVGSVGFDLDALAAVDPTVSGRGLLLASFAHGPLGTTLRYRFVGATRDPEAHQPVDALVSGVHLVGGFNRLRLAARVNVPETATDAEELVLSRVRHRRGLGGRADVIVTGGDIPGTEAWVVSECWSAGLESTYRLVRKCPGDGIGGDRCTLVAATGEERTCPAGLAAAELPPADPMADFPDADDPNEAAPAPTTMPDGAAPEG